MGQNVSKVLPIIHWLVAIWKSRALTALVHQGASLEDALQRLAEPPRPRRKSAAARG
jgi:hypothetical protein